MFLCPLPHTAYLWHGKSILIVEIKRCLGFSKSCLHSISFLYYPQTRVSSGNGSRYCIEGVHGKTTIHSLSRMQGFADPPSPPPSVGDPEMGGGEGGGGGAEIIFTINFHHIWHWQCHI